MTAHPAAPLLAKDLGRMQHTNNRGETNLVCLPGFGTAGMTEPEADQAGTFGLAIAEAMIETLGRHNYQVIAKSELNARVQALAAEKQADEVTLQCNRCRQPVVRASTAGNARVDVKTMAQGLQAHMEMCR